MNASAPSIRTVDDAALAALSAGTLSRERQLMLSCQAAARPEILPMLGASDHVGGAILETARAEDLSADFLDRLDGRLDEPAGSDEPRKLGRQRPDHQTPGPARPDRPSWMPGPLADYLAAAGLELKWRRVGLWVERAPISETPGKERMYLLRARAGLGVPRHGHAGEEWTLILTCGYHVGEEGYVAGDLHREDETCFHQLRIDDDGPCICLVVDDGPLIFANPMLRLVQPLLGI